MPLEQELLKRESIIINQRKELAELVGFETRNKYSIETTEGLPIGFAAEQQKGFAGIILRQFLGHWRKFELYIFGPDRQQEFRAIHPFRFYFQRLEVYRQSGDPIGALEKRFSIFSKKFDMLDRAGNVIMEVRSPLWKVWTFSFKKNGTEVAVIKKKWSGMIKEAFIDADRFMLEFSSPSLTAEERVLLTAAGVFIDLQYFENNQGAKRGILDLIPS